MNILDENVPERQRALLRSKRVALQQIGRGVGRKGMKNDEIIALLHKLDRPTFFTLDGDFYDRRLCHEEYCLVHIYGEEEMVAEYVRRLLRHRELNTKTKRMGCVIQAFPKGLTLWRIHQKEKGRFSWQ